MTGAAKDSLYAVLRYSVFAVAILVLGRFYWWPGFICFVVFAFQVAGRLLLSGIILLIVGLVARLGFRFIRAWGLHPTKFEKGAEAATNLFWLNLIIVITEGILVVMTILLGLSFFRY